MIKKILVVLVAAVAAVLAYAAMQPDTFSLQRSASIAATPERLYPLIADVKAFNAWNPWLRKDPSSKLTYDGPPAGVGSAYAWESDQLGSGRMELTELTPSSRVAMKLQFFKPMSTTNNMEFKLQPQGAQTNVTWTMSGPMPYLSKLICLFVSMDRMVGPDFEAGLANLGAAAEKK
ncbi:MAG TPA: SRPBCC family protein [Burkholderiaceae bacterium]|nr:SRPBCC family protein [Burkholderiaceae bacterium]